MDGQVERKAAPFGGPYSLFGVLLNGAAAIDEGIWIDLRAMKNASIEIIAAGTMPTFTIQPYASNAEQPPVNTMTATIGGSSTAGDVTTINFLVNVPASDPVIPPQQKHVLISYTSLSGDATSVIAAALNAAINADQTLNPLLISSTVSGSVLTITWPGTTAVSLSKNVSGSATETVTFALGTNGTQFQSGATITAAGVYNVAPIPRWYKQRLTAISGTNAAITANLAGNA